MKAFLSNPGTWKRLVGTSLACLLAIAWAAPAGAAGSADKVKVETEAGKIGADGLQEIKLTITVEDGWHIYANPVGNDDLADAATKVSITSKTKPKTVKVDYPKGKVINDKTLGDYSTYEGKVVIKTKVTRAKGDTGPLDVTISLQSCNEKTCLPPGKVKVIIGEKK